MPATETTSERSLQVPGDSRPRPDRRDSSAYARQNELEKKAQLSQEALPKVTQTTTLTHRDIPNRRNQDPSQRKDGYGNHDRHETEEALSSSFNRRRGDDSPDPDPDQPSSGGTIGFTKGDLGSRSLQDITVNSSARHRPEGGSRPDPEPDQPSRPYGFSEKAERAHEPPSKLDARHRTEDRPRASQLEPERPSVNRAGTHYHTDQQGVTTTSRERRSERAPEASLPRRLSPHRTSSGRKNDHKDVYERRK
jgi:hypothetical protein